MATTRRAPPPPEFAGRIEVVPVHELRPHPRNYQSHPDDELTHLMYSLQTHGFYRNIICARDLTILAGHGIALAAQRLGLTHAPILRLPLDPSEPKAMKILVGDNEMSRLSLKDDRALTEILRDLRQGDQGLDTLLGTGFDETMLAALTFVTRPASEIGDKHDAAQWVGLPDYDAMEDGLRLIVHFREKADQRRCLQQLDLDAVDDSRTVISTWWPPKARDDLASLRFEG